MDAASMVLATTKSQLKNLPKLSDASRNIMTQLVTQLKVDLRDLRDERDMKRQQERLQQNDREWDDDEPDRDDDDDEGDDEVGFAPFRKNKGCKSAPTNAGKKRRADDDAWFSLTEEEKVTERQKGIHFGDELTIVGASQVRKLAMSDGVQVVLRRGATTEDVGIAVANSTGRSRQAVLMVGGNDVMRGLAPSTTMGQMEKTATHLLEHADSVIVVPTLDTPMINAKHHNSAIRDAIERVRWRTGRNIWVGTPLNLSDDDFNDDDIHLNQKGRSKLKQSIYMEMYFGDPRSTIAWFSKDEWCRFAASQTIRNRLQ